MYVRTVATAKEIIRKKTRIITYYLLIYLISSSFSSCFDLGDGEGIMLPLPLSLASERLEERMRV